MNKDGDGIAGKWQQYSSKVRKQLGKLMDDESLEVDKYRDILAVKIWEKYDTAKEEGSKKQSGE